jgi:hypothetical protein
MSAPQGYSNQKKFGKPQFLTFHPIGSDKFAQNIISRTLAEYSAVNIAITAQSISTDQKELTLTIPAHGAKVTDVVRIYSGLNPIYELDIISVPSVNTVVVHNVIPSGTNLVGSDAKTMFYVTPKSDAEGNMNFSPGPTTYLRDGIVTTVTKDTAVPANNRALPVEIISASGAVINVTAGDINVQLSHNAASPDSVRVGDGVEELAINAQNEALVHDQDTHDKLDTLNTAAAGLATEVTLAAIAADIASLEAKDFATETTLASMDAELVAANASLDAIEAIIASVDTSLNNIEAIDFATEAKQDDIITELNNIEADIEATNVALVAVNASLDVIEAIDFATEAKQDDIITELQGIGASLGASQTVIDQIDTTPVLNMAATNIPASGAGHLKIIDNLAGNAKKLIIHETAGAFIGIYDNALNLIGISPPGGVEIPVNLTATHDLYLESMGAAVASGQITVQVVG